MKTRKLQEVGGGTFTVSIPKGWAETRRLEAGAEVHLYPHGDGSILLSAAATDGDDLESATVAIAGDSPARVTRALRAAAAAGFETITLVPDATFTDEQLRAARAAARSLVGTVIDAETPEEITLRHVLDVADVSIRQSVLQLQYAALSIHEEGTAAFLGGDGDAAERLRRRADEVQRQRAMVARHCNRALQSLAAVDRLDSSRTAVFDAHETATRLERVADLGVEIARAAERVGDRPSTAPVLAAASVEGDLADDVENGAVDDVTDASDAARELVASGVTAVLDDTCPAAAHDLFDRRNRVAGELDALGDAIDDAILDPSSGRGAGTAERTRATTVALTRVHRHLEETVRCGGEIAAVALRSAARAENLDAPTGQAGE